MTSAGTAAPTSSGVSLDEQLQSFVGLSTGPVQRAPDAVNLPMIRHWVEAMGDHNPVYVDDEAARAVGFPGIIAPPTMLQAWIMRGLRASQASDAARAQRDTGGETGGHPKDDSPSDRLMALLDEHGFTSVVATNCDQHYDRPLVPGDHLEVTSTIDAVSGQKATGLGVGHFITTKLEYADQDGRVVATMLFRILEIPAEAEAGIGVRHPGGQCRPRPTPTPPARTHPGQPVLL